MPYKQFDRSKLNLLPISERAHDLYADRDIMKLSDPLPEFSHPAIDTLAHRIIDAKKCGAAVIFMMGAHVIRSGVTPFLIDMMEHGIVTHFALNGAGAIHDYELAKIGATSESVARYISEGQFGLWNETGGINEAASCAYREGIGFGEAIGRAIETGKFPHKDISLLAAGYRLQVPVTIHVGIGNDIVHEHPNCDGAAIGAASYTDFLIYANTIDNLENGVFINFGSAVAGPEVYLKCLSMVRNVAKTQNRQIAHFTTAVCDLLPIEDDIRKEPPKSNHYYYFRPWKTIMARTVADGGESFYIQGEHKKTVTALYKRIGELL